MDADIENGPGGRTNTSSEILEILGDPDNESRPLHLSPHSVDDHEERPKLAPSPTEGVTIENEASISVANLKDFYDRFRAVESKMSMVDTMHSLQESTEEAFKYSKFDQPNAHYWDHESQRVQGHLNFYRDAMYFMSRIRESHQRIHQQHLAHVAIAEAAEQARKNRKPESEIIKRISSKAFLNKEAAKVIQVDWNDFILRRDSGADIEKSILAPVEVVSGEPESQTIMQLETIRRKDKKPRPLGVLAERVPLTGENGERLYEQPLPERIKVHSDHLVAIFSQIIKGPNLIPTSQKDGSMVFLRPYQELVYYEDQLRMWLADLEKSFEAYDGTDGSLDPTETENDNTIGGNVAQPVSTENPSIDSSTGEKEANKTDAVDESTSEIDDIEHEQDDRDPHRLSRSITALLHLRCLLHFIDTEIKPKQEYVGSMRCSRIHFHDLWYLFKPGDRVIDHEEKQVYVVLRVQPPQHKGEEPWERWNRLFGGDTDSNSDSDDEDDDDNKDANPFTLHCAYIDFDGKAFGPISKKFRVSPFGELKQIKSLPVYPFRFAKDSRAHEKIVNRSKMLLDVAKHKAMYYMGVTLDKRDEIDSQVVIDFNEALADDKRRKAWEPKIASVNTAPERRPGYEYCAAACCVTENPRQGTAADTRMTEDYLKTLVPDTSLGAPSLILSPRSLEETLHSMDELTETEFLVMTYRVFGFVLRSRKWAQLDLAMLRYENSNVRNLTVSAFKELELPEGHKEMVKSLVVQHFRAKQSTLTRDEQTDLIQGKGKGLILLLHGEPGVGKTTTAEGIAELFRKPLFQITCGDLGTTAKEVEFELEKNFALASRWGCILLLDEADVFLAARQRQDFIRNGLVAVFLRVLEYYTGILFLTTNRVGDFDEAFASRIRISLYYPPLDEEKTLRVFELNLKLIKQRFESQGRTIVFDPSSIEDFARNHFRENKYRRWNGRQIRNACQTALALAEFDAQGDMDTLAVDEKIDKAVVVQLQLKYFQTVQRAYIDFDKYMGDIHGTQSDPRAYEHQLRAKSQTPFQPSKPSRFAQRQESGSFAAQSGSPQHLHTQSASDMLRSNLASQQGPHHQPYRPTTPGANLPHSKGYRQYPPQMSRPQSFQEPAGNSGGYENPTSFGQPSSAQQIQMNAAYEQDRQQTQYFESSQSRFMPGYKGEITQRPGPAYDDSPSVLHSNRHHQSHYSYGHGGNTGQESEFQDSGASIQGESLDVPRSTLSHGQEDLGGRDNMFPFGGSDARNR